MNARRVGIIGAAGQVGSALLKTLNTDRELTAFGICRNSVSAARVACQGMPVRIARTEDAEQLTQATRDLDILVNCALPQYGSSRTSAANRRLANSLAAACAGKHLVHLSSVAVYGTFISARKSLFDNPKPDSLYGRQKLQMENLLRTLARKHSMSCTILRVGHVYGAELRWSEIFFELIRKEGFRLPFDGQLPSNAIGITNLRSAIRKVLFSEPLQITLNLTDAPQTSWRDIFDLHSQASGGPTVECLNPFESAWRFRERKKWAETGLTARVARETWAWGRHMPASFIASVPAFRPLLQLALERLSSEKLEARLWAIYHKRFASGMEANPDPGILPVFLSEPVPGPCLSYEASSPTVGLAALQDWHDAISAPQESICGAIPQW